MNSSRVLNSYEKFIFGLTVRQFASVATALAICIPLYIFGKKHIGADLAGWLVILAAAPVFAFGFLKFNGMRFEQFVKILWRQTFIAQQKRIYEELPVYYICREEIKEDTIARQTAALKLRRKDKVQRDSKRKKSRQIKGE